MSHIIFYSMDPISERERTAFLSNGVNGRKTRTKFSCLQTTSYLDGRWTEVQGERGGMPRNSDRLPFPYLGGRKATLKETATERRALYLSRSVANRKKPFFREAISLLLVNSRSLPRSLGERRGNKEVFKWDKRGRFSRQKGTTK